MGEEEKKKMMKNEEEEIVTCVQPDEGDDMTSQCM
jgi:hypothetical protein